MITSRYVTRAVVGYLLALHARQALGPHPPGPGFLNADSRYWAEQLGQVIRHLHTLTWGRRPPQSMYGQWRHPWSQHSPWSRSVAAVSTNRPLTGSR